MSKEHRTAEQRICKALEVFIAFRRGANGWVGEAPMEVAANKTINAMAEMLLWNKKEEEKSCQ